MTRLQTLLRGGEVLHDARAVRDAALPVTRDDESLRPLIDALADKSFVLLGEATHGTADFYRLRARISRILIERHGFAGIVAEADWPDAERVHRHLRGVGDDGSAEDALGGFERFPRWMWRNAEVAALVHHLRSYNDRLPPGAAKAGFWGMDLYSLYGSIAAVLEYLDRADPGAAERARERYGCFGPYAPDPQRYGAAAAGFGRFAGDDCEQEVTDQLRDLVRRRNDLSERWRDGTAGEDEQFYAEQNARLVAGAERYYREMYRGRTNTWNLRDTHMADMLDALRQHLRATGRPDKLVVWAHNSHLGDARATEAGGNGEVNVGSLLRERHGAAVFNVGFTCDRGTVAAADNWDEPPQRKQVTPARPDSVEGLLHAAATLDGPMPAMLLTPRLDPDSAATRVLTESRLGRAIGVIYRPRTERQSHYFHARAARQFDAIVHVDDTTALTPLDPYEGFEPGHAAAPETFPSGL